MTHTLAPLHDALKLVNAGRLNDDPPRAVIEALEQSFGAIVWRAWPTLMTQPLGCYLRCCGVSGGSGDDEQAMLAEWSINAVARLRAAGIRP